DHEGTFGVSQSAYVDYMDSKWLLYSGDDNASVISITCTGAIEDNNGSFDWIKIYKAECSPGSLEAADQDFQQKLYGSIDYSSNMEMGDGINCVYVSNSSVNTGVDIKN
ncbi:hypothetical protein KIPB_013221, partial [Kipferlia bialata]